MSWLGFLIAFIGIALISLGIVKYTEEKRNQALLNRFDKSEYTNSTFVIYIGAIYIFIGLFFMIKEVLLR
jgi:uncharacterized membrane protein YidH (DUF202 family)